MTRAALEKSIRRGKLALKDATKLSDILAELSDADFQPVGELPFPPVPEKIKITDRVRDALIKLPTVFNSVEPRSRRTLTKAEVADLYEENDTLQAIETLVKKRREALKEYVRTHLDIQAEDDGHADERTSPRDSHGHYVLGGPENPEKLPIPEANLNWVREYRAPKITLEALENAEADGLIDHETLLAFTTQTRAVDEDKIFAAIRKDPELLEELALVTRSLRPSSAINVRK